MTTPAETLTAAADHIERVGWSQGDYFEFRAGVPFSEAPCCALGAIRVVTRRFQARRDRVEFFKASEDSAELKASYEAEVALAGELGCRIWNIPTWNDNRDRTATEVVHTLRRAADRARKLEKVAPR